MIRLILLLEFHSLLLRVFTKSRKSCKMDKRLYFVLIRICFFSFEFVEVVVFCVEINEANSTCTLSDSLLSPPHSVAALWFVCSVKSLCFCAHCLEPMHLVSEINSDIVSPSHRLQCCAHVLEVEKYLGAGVVCWAASCPDYSWSLSLWFLPFFGYQSVAVADCSACSLAIF